MELIKEHGCTPPVEWLQQNNLNGFYDAINDRFDGIVKWRDRYHNALSEQTLMISRAGLHHLSMAEVMLANYLSNRNRNPPRRSLSRLLQKRQRQSSRKI